MAKHLEFSVDAARVFALFDPEERAAFIESNDVAPEEIGDRFEAATLLGWIARRRSPFIKMARDIAAALEVVEARIPGNIDFLVTATGGSALTLDFGRQMRRMVAGAIDWSRLATQDELRHQAASLARATRALCERCRGRRVRRDDSMGRALRKRASLSPDPRVQLRGKFVADRLSRYVTEYSPMDAQRLQRIEERLAPVRGRLRDPERSVEAGRAIAQQVEAAWASVSQALGRARARVSREYPVAAPSLSDAEVDRLCREIAAFEVQVASASDVRETLSEIFDFFSLPVWRQRWRLYELWLFARVCRTLSRPGFGKRLAIPVSRSG